MIKFYCKICSKEMWQGMTKEMKETTTIAEAEDTAICSDCMVGMGVDVKENKDEQ